MIINIIILIAAIWTSFLLGFLTAARFKKIGDYVGVMKIIREDNKLVYSLELNEDPSMLEGKKEIVFKVESSDEKSNRR